MSQAMADTQRIKNFWSRVKKTKTCWLWQGARVPAGYGSFQYTKGTNTSAHRVSWIATFGNIPQHLYVCHICDVRLCVNPKHLWLGTNRQNIQDRDRKGRAAIGTRNGQSKLNWVKVRSIRSLHKHGHSCISISKIHGVSDNVISRIVRGKLWKTADAAKRGTK